MDDGDTLSFIREQAANAHYTFSVCTGALILGAAGLLKGRKATTHWAALHLLKYFGAIPVAERVAIDGNVVSTAGVTAGIDGALRVAALLRGEQNAQEIQLGMQYAPDPPFNSGAPDSAPPQVFEAVRSAFTSGRWKSGKRLWARSTPTWRDPWKTMLPCYERCVVGRKQRVWRLEPMQFALRAPD
jgi:cyclohexyl-isocyanide hydratase